MSQSGPAGQVGTAKPLATGEQVVASVTKSTSRFDREVDRIRATLNETREGSKMFDVKDKKVCLPRNWNQLVEVDNFFLVADKCISMLAYDTMFDEQDFTDSLSGNTDFRVFVDGLLFSLTETGIDKSNFSTTSKLEQGRIEGQTRRAVACCSSEGIPFKWTKQAKANVLVTGTQTDSLYRTILPNINSRNYNIRIGLWFVRLFSAAQAQLGRGASHNISNMGLSFDEVWTRIGDIKKDTAGKVKYDKSGNPKRYHPKVPDFGGMQKDEIIASKQLFGKSWKLLQEVRDQWPELEKNTSTYENGIKLLQSIYASQTKSTKTARAYVDARIEGLGLPRTATKAAIANRINQRKATENYEPKFGIPELANTAKSCYMEILHNSKKLAITLVKDDDNGRSGSAEAGPTTKPTTPPKGDPRQGSPNKGAL